MGAAAMHLPSFVDGEIQNKEELEQTIVCLQYACELGMQYQVEIGHEAVLVRFRNMNISWKRCILLPFTCFLTNENLSLQGNGSGLYLQQICG